MSENKENNEKEESGTATKVADSIADGYEKVNEMQGKATANMIRTTGKIVDQTILDNEDMVEGAKKAVKRGGKKVLEGGKNTVKKVAKGVRDATSDTDKKDKDN